MNAPRRAASSARQFFGDCDRFVREYTAGLRAQDLRRLFDRDAAAAYGVLTRDAPDRPEPKSGFRRFWHRVRIVFLGLSYKLTPARRVLFAAAMVAFLLGVFDLQILVRRSGSVDVSFGLSSIWLIAAVAALVFLLSLELVDRIRVRDELEVARELQTDLLPRTVPDLRGYHISHAYRTANEVGGDYYDFSLLEDGRLALMVGDASGHGMAAGLLMAIANATLGLAVDLDPSPPEVLRLLNRTLCRTGDNRAFMSIFYALLDPASGAMEYACAGHPFPLLRRYRGGVEELGEGGLPLGFRRDLLFGSRTVVIEPGDVLVLYSDGLPEGVDQAGETFGYERLQELVAEPGTPQAIHQRILRAFDQHRGEQPLGDDFSLVVLGRDAAAAVAAS
ncbi:MAG TPA: PP2C family protein-serine/threonine phosphatase [Thermoanaerobaculia bacterium]|nr:PP2C family protein-serine/threonine phosphatase [Thermoanaerobaculia bacterium]